MFDSMMKHNKLIAERESATNIQKYEEYQLTYSSLKKYKLSQYDEVQ